MELHQRDQRVLDLIQRRGGGGEGESFLHRSRFPTLIDAGRQFAHVALDGVQVFQRGHILGRDILSLVAVLAGVLQTAGPDGALVFRVILQPELIIADLHVLLLLFRWRP